MVEVGQVLSVCELLEGCIARSRISNNSRNAGEDGNQAFMRSVERRSTWNISLSSAITSFVPFTCSRMICECSLFDQPLSSLCIPCEKYSIVSNKWRSPFQRLIPCKKISPHHLKLDPTWNDEHTLSNVTLRLAATGLEGAWCGKKYPFDKNPINAIIHPKDPTVKATHTNIRNLRDFFH